MHWIEADNAADYLRRLGWIAGNEPVWVEPLAGGVSNAVFYVSRPAQPDGDFVLKQARPQLRVPDPWFCGVERIWREVEVLRICQELLAAASVQRDAPQAAAPRAGGDVPITTPRILHEDRENFAFAMTAAPRRHSSWKELLLAGEVDPRIAARCGWLLGTLHARTWNDDRIAARLGDRTIFDQLRLDPYYRTLARAFPEMQASVAALVDDVWRHRQALVHADFSPKNLLVWPGGMMMLDFETGHYGDPAFDLGFFLSHLVLKACRAAPRHAAYLALTGHFWSAYQAVVAARVSPPEYAALLERAVRNFAACAWARLDGKSRVEYLTEPRRRDAVRHLARELLQTGASTWADVTRAAERSLAAL